MDSGSVLHSLWAGVFDVLRTTAQEWSGPRGAALPALDAHASARSLRRAAEKLQHGSIRRDSPYPVHEPESREPCAEGQN